MRDLARPGLVAKTQTLLAAAIEDVGPYGDDLYVHPGCGRGLQTNDAHAQYNCSTFRFLRRSREDGMFIGLSYSSYSSIKNMSSHIRYRR